jgi:DNA-binding NarL/FixJ family response regulator
MRVFWEKVGLLGPVFRLGSQGLSDSEIASRLNITEVKVHDCIASILNFLQLTDRKELARYASVRPTIWRCAACS